MHVERTDAQAEQIRLAENLHRKDPSIYDVAVSLRRVRHHQGFTRADEVAKFTGLPVTRVKHYLNLFNASDTLLQAIEQGGLTLAVAQELLRCERQIGESASRRLIRRACSQEISAADPAPPGHAQGVVCRSRTEAPLIGDSAALAAALAALKPKHRDVVVLR